MLRHGVLFLMYCQYQHAQIDPTILQSIAELYYEHNLVTTIIALADYPAESFLSLPVLFFLISF